MAVRNSGASAVIVVPGSNGRIVSMGSQTPGSFSEHSVSPAVEVVAGHWRLHPGDLWRAVDGVVGDSLHRFVPSRRTSDVLRRAGRANVPSVFHISLRSEEHTSELQSPD